MASKCRTKEGTKCCLRLEPQTAGFPKPAARVTLRRQEPEMTTDEPSGEPSGEGVEATGSDATDEGGSRHPKAKAPKKRRTGLYVGLAALTVVGAGAASVALWMFSSVGKSRSVAREHLPPTCDIVARADIAKIQGLPSFQTNMKPAIDELTSQATSLDDPDIADLRSFLVEARLDPARDLEEVVGCVVDPVGAAKFAFIFGGTFSTEGVVDAAASRGDSSERVKIEGRPAVKAKSKKGGGFVYLGQAEDGAIVFSNDEALLASALKKSDAHQAVYKLPTASEVSLVVTSGLMSKQADRIRANPMLKAFGSVTGATGSLGFAAPGGQARLTTGSAATATDVEREIAGLLALSRLKSSILGGGGGGKPGLMDALGSLKTSVQGSDVVLDFPWSPQGVDDAMGLAAEALRKAKKKG